MIETMLASGADDGTPMWMTLMQVEHAWQAGWVLLGLAGQMLYFGRMALQWIASEMKRESIVPPAFWWCSLLGSIMLLTYFIWRREPIGILGQSFGFVVYGRNLYLIYVRPGRAAPVAD